jgi:aryl-alcohol dehydrogenase-like predicted oxidoreductase
LTPKAEHLPARLSALREAADAVRRAFSAGWSDLPSLALRYCLSLDAIDTVLVGVRTLAELDAALAAVAAGPLDAAELARLPATECDPRLLDPSTWDLP